jgi:hypothetical protein
VQSRWPRAELTEVDDDADDNEDDMEALVTPLRQTGAQAAVGNRVKRRRPGVMEEYEVRIISQDLWDPSATMSRYAIRSIQELQAIQPWCSMLAPELLNRMHRSESEEVAKCAFSSVAERPC